ncbi:PEPxxWA-CTERM sorting domain-containing protein [Sandarakinorhabdus sp.]|uniref:PEPxxWA-CTERM sorting domain-containing protein n=1 Tax=Sandarakinorhabdus sp. TaxID=1916663 RepID=UPI00334189A1
MMRMILLAGASLAALASTAAEAVTFNYTGAAQSYTITQTGIYTLGAAGAQGGGDQGGLGAFVFGRLSLTSGTVLNIIVGGKGLGATAGSSTYGGGGGGGTFIYTDLSTPHAIAAGGGGDYSGNSGGYGRAYTGGGTTNSEYSGGTGGSGGQGGSTAYGGGGGGWLSDGGSRAGRGGRGGPNGFNGGSGDAKTGYHGGFGGGGGFSGGGGSYYTGGGGGGSFLAASATNTVLTAGINSGDGSASIDLFSAAGGVPEPSSWAMLITGFGGVGAMLRRRRLRTA